jgi:hypothetical protein
LDLHGLGPAYLAWSYQEVSEVRAHSSPIFDCIKGALLTLDRGDTATPVEPHDAPAMRDASPTAIKCHRDAAPPSLNHDAERIASTVGGKHDGLAQEVRG